MNLLSLAMSVVGAQGLQWRKFTGRTTNAAGYQVTSYADAQAIQGSAQPVPRSMYEKLGLDWNREYLNVYTPANVVTVGRDNSGDRIVYGGATWACESGTDWSLQAGWVQITAVKVPTP